MNRIWSAFTIIYIILTIVLLVSQRTEVFIWPQAFTWPFVIAGIILSLLGLWNFPAKPLKRYRPGGPLPVSETVIGNGFPKLRRPHLSTEKMAELQKPAASLWKIPPKPSANNEVDLIGASLGLTWDDVTDPKLLALREKTNVNDFINSLEQIAPYDDYAAEILRRARERGIGQKA